MYRIHKHRSQSLIEHTRCIFTIFEQYEIAVRAHALPFSSVIELPVLLHASPRLLPHFNSFPQWNSVLGPHCILHHDRRTHIGPFSVEPRWVKWNPSSWTACIFSLHTNTNKNQWANSAISFSPPTSIYENCSYSRTARFGLFVCVLMEFFTSISYYKSRRRKKKLMKRQQHLWHTIALNSGIIYAIFFFQYVSCMASSQTLSLTIHKQTKTMFVSLSPDVWCREQNQKRKLRISICTLHA